MKLNESKGTPDAVSKVITDNYSNIISSIGSNESLVFDISDVKLTCNIQINFITHADISYYGNINFLNCIKSNFTNCIINLKIPKNPDNRQVVKTLAHELTHLYELYQIKDLDKTKWKRQQFLHDISDENVDKSIKYFRDMFYASLPQEINARVSSLYRYLLIDKEKGSIFLEDMLKKTNEWKNYENLMNFSYQELSNDLIKKYTNNKKELYDIFNDFNKGMGIKTVINTDNELLTYFHNTNRYYKKVAKDYKKRMLRIIDKIIKENILIEYTTCDHIIVEYVEYIKRDIEKDRDHKIDLLLNYINYMDFFDKI